MQKLLQRKLEWYGLSATGIFMLSTHANAQIAYTDLDPDVIRDEGDIAYFLNVDGGGTPIDFFFGINYGYYSIFGSNVINAGPWFFEESNGIVGVPYTYAGFFNVAMAYQLEEGASIGPGSPFVDNNFIETSSYLPQGFLAVNPEFGGQPNLWEDDGNPHILGIKFVKDGLLHYGWVRLSIDPGFAVLHIYDYAWNMTPGESIIAGDAGGCSAPEVVGSGAITSVSAKVKWSASMDADLYEVNFRAIGAPDWNVAPVDAPKTFRKLSGLDCNTTYEWKVRSICTGGSPSLFSSTATFTTGICRMEGDLSDNIEVYAYGKTVYFNLPDDVQTTLKIFDMTGNEVVAGTQITGNYSIATQLPSGIYIAQLNVDGENISYKVVLSE